MQSEIVRILTESFPLSELSLDSYHKTCTCIVIDKNRNCYIIDKNTEINFEIASIAFIINSNNVLCTFVTDRKFRDKHYGENLLTCLTEMYDNLSLYVRVSNEPAINLYKKKGFEIKEKKNNFYNYTENNEDAYYMSFSKK